ncbi:hypothetical protein A9Q89_00760 [Gammaproteobacteria bacterium 53_120_T64]|nr:hypothetical protein A9Q89_00760 [Gammaproteobacteria bacterium 53_120_T64]
MSCSILASPKLGNINGRPVPRIGIILADVQRREALRTVVEAHGFSVNYCGVLPVDTQARIAGSEVDAWLADECDVAPALPFPESQPLLVCRVGAAADTGLWRGVVERQLDDLVQNHRQLCEASRASKVWLLAASAGGLHAVRRFLADLNTSYGVAFVYAQHIDAEQAEQLVKMIVRNTSWRAGMARDGKPLANGSVTVVPPQQRISLSRGLVSTHNSGWPGPYAPSIDNVAGELAREYGSACGMIVFSGLGDDGVAGSHLIRDNGGSVLVQSPADCTVPALSEAVLKYGSFCHSGSVEQLRERFIKLQSSGPGSSGVGFKGVVRGGK